MQTPEKPHRFYKAVTTAPHDAGGFAVLLDGRPARSPGRHVLALPTLALADLVAAEWEAQGSSVDFGAMPMTRLAFTVLDRAADARAGLAAEVARFAGSDLLCYLADGPDSLVEREQAAWAPWRDWAGVALGLPLLCTAGIVPVDQPPDSVARAEALALELDDFALTGLAYAASLLGSAVLAFAVQRGAVDAAAAFATSRIDEAFQEERWGVDDEAADRTAGRLRDAEMIGRWFGALR